MDLIQTLKSPPLQKIKVVVDERVKSFEETYNKDNETWVSELCFCILTANSSAMSGLKVQSCVNPEQFMTLSEKDLRTILKDLGYRFYNKRAKYIFENQIHFKTLKEVLLSLKNSEEKRDWLVKNIKGMGYKEASHFLRNVGHKDIAIIDRHILRVLSEYGYIKETKLNPRRYKEIEYLLKNVANKAGLDLASLDLFLWYMKTKKVLK